MDETRWHIALFLGSAELVGGSHDGQVQHLEFKFDISRSHGSFQRVDKLVGILFPSEPLDDDAACPCLNMHVEGMLGSELVVLRVYAFALEEAGPGVRCKENGTWELV